VYVADFVEEILSRIDPHIDLYGWWVSPINVGRCEAQSSLNNKWVSPFELPRLNY